MITLPGLPLQAMEMRRPGYEAIQEVIIAIQTLYWNFWRLMELLEITRDY